MEITSYRDLKHNYLVIKLSEPDRDDYQFRMVEQNTLHHFIPCSIHNINGEAFLYYEVDARQSLRMRYSTRRMRHEDVTRLIQDLCRAGEEAQEYLLDPEGILLTPELIFEDTEGGHFSFCFCPERADDGTSGMGFPDLVEQLVALTDPGDMRAADLVYGMCERAHDGTLLPTDVLSSLTEGRSLNAGEDGRQTGGDGAGHAAPGITSQPDLMWRAAVQRNAEGAAKGGDASERVQQDRGMTGRSRSGIAMAVLCMGVACALFALRYYYVLTPREDMLDMALMLVCLGMGVVSLILSLRGRGGTGKEPVKEPAAAPGMASAERLDQGFHNMDIQAIPGMTPAPSWALPTPATQAVPLQASPAAAQQEPALHTFAPQASILSAPVPQVVPMPQAAPMPAPVPQTPATVRTDTDAVLLDFGVPNTDHRFQLCLKDVIVV